MSLAGQIALTAARLVQHRAGAYAERALHLARRTAEEAADLVEAASPRMATLAEAGLRLTEITCRCVDQLVRQGIESAQGTLTDGAERLRMTAKARSFGALYAAQREALPATRRRVGRDLERAWHIMTTTSRELVALARATRSELEGKSARRTTAAARPRARKRPSRRRAGGRHAAT